MMYVNRNTTVVRIQREQMLCCWPFISNALRCLSSYLPYIAHRRSSQCAVSHAPSFQNVIISAIINFTIDITDKVLDFDVGGRQTAESVTYTQSQVTNGRTV